MLAAVAGDKLASAIGKEARRFFPWLLVLCVSVGVIRRVLALPPLWGVAPALARACFVASALAFVASLVTEAGDAGHPPKLSLAPLLAIAPWCLPPAWLSDAQLALVGIAALALVEWSRAPTRTDARAVAVSPLALALGIAITLVALAWDRHGHFDNDPAYYAGVARHIVTSGRWEEPIVWHFQGLPNEAVHAPFDHWQPMTALALMVPMKLFGTSDRVVYVTMACLSGASIVALAALLGWAAPLKSRALALAGTGAFGLSPFLLQYRLDSETMPVVHLLLLVSLLLIARGHGALAMVPAWCLPLTRLDAGLWAPILTLAALARPSAIDDRPGARRGRHERATVALAAIGCALMVGAVWRASHGSFLPPAGTRAAMLGGYDDLYAYADGLPTISPFHFESRWTVAAFLDAGKHGLAAWFDQPLLGLQPLWIAAALFLGVASPSPIARGATAIVASLCFVAPWSSFHMYAPWRVSMVGVVALVLAAILGLDHVLDAARGTWTRPASLLARATLAVALVWGQWAGSTTPMHTAIAEEDAFRAVAPALAGHIVLTPHPFAGVAAQSAPVVMLPWNGEAAVSKVIKRFGITRLVLGIGGCSGETAALCTQVLAGKSELLGGISVRALPPLPGAPRVRVFALSSPR